MTAGFDHRLSGQPGSAVFTPEQVAAGDLLRTRVEFLTSSVAVELAGVDERVDQLHRAVLAYADALRTAGPS